MLAAPDTGAAKIFLIFFEKVLDKVILLCYHSSTLKQRRKRK